MALDKLFETDPRFLIHQITIFPPLYQVFHILIGL
jgi:hypothetical protein